MKSVRKLIYGVSLPLTNFLICRTGDHECIFQSESVVLELSVYLTEFETFDYLRDRANLVCLM